MNELPSAYEIVSLVVFLAAFSFFASSIFILLSSSYIRLSSNRDSIIHSPNSCKRPEVKLIVSLSLLRNPYEEVSTVKQCNILKSLQIAILAQFSLYFSILNLQLKNLNI